ncbi:MAG: peroxidase-related enzyme [Actinomycetota bacterium]|nr:peroxidase-related enzyme [Actinomycetota bacterium]
MTHLPSLPGDAKLLDVFRAYPETARPLLDYHEVLMRGESPLSEAERELIAAYVSGLNACDYCFGIHQTTAQAFGVEEGLLTALLADVETADVDERMRPLLSYVGKVTREPARVSSADARRVLDAGWDEQALHDAVSVCALFNFMNRFVNGLGVSAGEDYFDVSGNRLANHGYAGLKTML